MVIDSGRMSLGALCWQKGSRKSQGVFAGGCVVSCRHYSLEHNRFYGRVRSHQHHSLGDKQSAKTGTRFDAFHSTLLGSEGNFLACFIDSDVLSTPCSWESSTSTFHVAVSILEKRHHPLASRIQLVEKGKRALLSTSCRHKPSLRRTPCRN